MRSQTYLRDIEAWSDRRLTLPARAGRDEVAGVAHAYAMAAVQGLDKTGVGHCIGLQEKRGRRETAFTTGEDGLGTLMDQGILRGMRSRACCNASLRASYSSWVST